MEGEGQRLCRWEPLRVQSASLNCPPVTSQIRHDVLSNRRRDLNHDTDLTVKAFTFSLEIALRLVIANFSVPLNCTFWGHLKLCTKTYSSFFRVHELSSPENWQYLWAECGLHLVPVLFLGYTERERAHFPEESALFLSCKTHDLTNIAICYNELNNNNPVFCHACIILTKPAIGNSFYSWKRQH